MVLLAKILTCNFASYIFLFILIFFITCIVLCMCKENKFPIMSQGTYFYKNSLVLLNFQFDKTLAIHANILNVSTSEHMLKCIDVLTCICA